MTLDVREASEQEGVSRQAGVDSADRQLLLATLLATVATTLLLESIRVFLSYVMFTIDNFRVALIVVAVAAFPAMALGDPFIRWRGARATLLLAVVVLGVFRLLMQFWTDPSGRIVIASVAIASWGWLMLALLRTRREAAAFGFAAGLGVDLLIAIAFRTLDLPWMPSLAAHVVTVLLVGVLVVSALALRPRDSDPSSGMRSPSTLFVIGPGLFIYLLVTGSIGLVEVNADVSFPAAAAILSLGMALGIAGSTLLLRSPGARRIMVGYPAVLVLAAVGGFGLHLAWQAGAFAPVGFVVAGAISTILLTHALLGPDRHVGDHGPGRETLWFMVGIGLLAIFLLAYFTTTGPGIPVTASYVALVAVALACHRVPRGEVVSNRSVLAVPALLAASLAFASAWHGLTWSSPEAGEPLEGTITVMTYNIQIGFSADDDFDLEAIAQTIEAADPDVVVLQEVARGWPFTTGIDQALWLSQRLDMPFVFGTHPANALWDPAIFSKAPIDVMQRRQFDTQHFDHGAIATLVQTEGEDPWIFGVHFAAPRGAEQARLKEAEQLVDFWDGRSPALILGDFNATADSLALQALRSIGLIDIGQATGETEPSFVGGERIDHILATPGVEVIEIEVLESRASDHFPIVVVIRLDDAP